MATESMQLKSSSSGQGAEMSAVDQPPEVLLKAVDAHGGIDRWRRFDGLASSIVIGGDLWGIKGIDMDRTPRRTTTSFRRQWTRQAPFGGPDWHMTWTPHQAEIVDGGGRVVAQRSGGRSAFDRDHAGKWDPLNLAYFNGYAMWIYHAAPFILLGAGYTSHEIPAVEHDGELLRGISVRFPPRIHTHSREQQFYFDREGLLRRHDYEVEVWGNAPAAHFLSDYVTEGGLRFPQRRRVYARKPDNTPDLRSAIVTIELSDYSVFRSTGATEPVGS